MLTRRKPPPYRTSPKPTPFLEALRHPLLTLLLGFLLTGIVRTWLTSFYSQKAKERETQSDEQRLNYEFGLKTIEEFSDRYFAYWTRAEMLYDALKQNVPDTEIRTRKAEYDQAYFELGSRIQTTLFRFRRALGAKDVYEDFETIVSRPLRKLNTCINEVTRAKLTKSKPTKVAVALNLNPGTCETDRLLYTVTVECGNRTHDELYKVIAKSRTPSSQAPNTGLSDALNQIKFEYCYIREPSDYLDPRAFAAPGIPSSSPNLRGF